MKIIMLCTSFFFTKILIKEKYNFKIFRTVVHTQGRFTCSFNVAAYKSKELLIADFGSAN